MTRWPLFAAMLSMAAGGACTTAEGILLEPTGSAGARGSGAGPGGAPNGPADCGTARTLLESDGVFFGSFPRPGGAWILWSRSGTIELADVDDAGRLVSAHGFASEPSVGSPALVADGGGWLAFHNHSLAGQWRVYLSPFDPAQPAIAWEDLVTVGQLGNENQSPALAVRQGEVAVAFRSDGAVGLARAADGVVLSQGIAPDGLPLPRVQRLVAYGGGYAALSLRDEAVLDLFDLSGTAVQRFFLGMETSDVVAVEDQLFALAGRTEGQVLLEIEGQTIVQEVPLDGISQSIRRLRMVSSGQQLIAVLADSSGIQVGTLEAASFSSLMALSLEPERLDVVSTSRGALLVTEIAGQIEATPLCFF